ncbi:MAG: hypothetical protein EZS28_045280 [Streblomastix strix]|uniref:Uncharacterized protein n=1 Tax=Streblomastix strix TaxID=222440 RepID=A0A5J4TN10_9EUKA|nr:MAG: hypothetical protein EZS28_045280 [Streblomastix strix]
MTSQHIYMYIINQNTFYRYIEKFDRWTFPPSCRGEGLDDNPKDKWTKRTQMQKDQPENHSDRDSTWTEDEVPQNQITTSQPKQPVQQTQRIQQVQVQPKLQALVHLPRYRGRRDAPQNQDDIDEQELLQEKFADLQKEIEQYDISDSENDWQQVIREIDNSNSQTSKQEQQYQ